MARTAWLFLVGLALCAAGAAAAAPRHKVAILPIVVHSSEEREHLQGGLADMLASRLGQSANLLVIRAEDPATATTKPDAAREAARTLGADWVLFGSFTRFGQGASLDVRCLRVKQGGSNDPRSIFIQAGTLGEIIPQLDGLAQKIARHVAVGGKGPMPDVGAPAFSLGQPVPELQLLSDRVRALEQQVFGESGGAPRRGGLESETVIGGEPDPAAELR